MQCLKVFFCWTKNKVWLAIPLFTHIANFPTQHLPLWWVTHNANKKHAMRHPLKCENLSTVFCCEAALGGARRRQIIFPTLFRPSFPLFSQFSSCFASNIFWLSGSFQFSFRPKRQRDFYLLGQHIIAIGSVKWRPICRSIFDESISVFP